jgi:hypothetical protein
LKLEAERDGLYCRVTAGLYFVARRSLNTIVFPASFLYRAIVSVLSSPAHFSPTFDQISRILEPQRPLSIVNRASGPSLISDIGGKVLFFFLI